MQQLLLFFQYFSIVIYFLFCIYVMIFSWLPVNTYTTGRMFLSAGLWDPDSWLHSLAFAQGVFNTVAPELFVVVNEGEGQVNIEGVGPVRGCCPLPWLKCNHQVHPSSRPLDLELVDEILTKDLTQQLLKFIVNPDRTVGTTWEKSGLWLWIKKNKNKLRLNSIDYIYKADRKSVLLYILLPEAL